MDLEKYKEEFNNTGYVLLKDYFTEEEGKLVIKYANELESCQEEALKWMIYFEKVDDIKYKSLSELTQEVNNIIEQLEKEKNLENSLEDYQKLIKLNNIIEKKFQNSSKKISLKTRDKISQILNNKK